MKNRPSLRLAACAWLCGAGLLQAATPAADQPIVAHDLQQLRVADKVSAVLWTRRQGYYTLQVVLPLRPGANRVLPFTVSRVPRANSTTAALARDPVAKVQVWLLRADGLALPPQAVSPPDLRRVGGRTQALEAIYSFSLAAGQEATAVAIQVDDDYFIEPLKPL